MKARPGISVMKAPRSLAELPFERDEPRALLGLVPGTDGEWRSEPDHDYGRFGWAEVEGLVLEGDDGARRRVGPALVLALHSTDEPSPDDGVIELELELHDVADDARADAGDDASEDVEPAEPLVIRAPLDRFLDVWLPRLPASAGHVVLALCNPLHLDPARPASLGPRNLHYAYGDVLSWLDHHEDRPASIRLRAHAWHTR
jgi:hypothetical protein